MGQNLKPLKNYQKAKDGLFYRPVELEGKIYQVPMYVNRLPYGWQVRFCRQGEAYYSCSFADSKTGMKEFHARVDVSLKMAINDVKSQFRKGSHDSRDELRAKITRFLMQEKNKSETNIPGVNCSLVFPKSNDREKTPYIRISTQLGVAPDKRITGPSYSKSIFSFTPNEFKSAVRNVVLHRKYMEEQHLAGRRYAPDAVPHISWQKERALLKDVDLAVFQFETYISEAEQSWPLMQEPAKFEASLTEDNDRFTVKSLNKKTYRREHKLSFSSKTYGTRELAKRIANLYKIYIERYEPYKGTHGRPISSRKPSHVKNKTPQLRTGITGVTFRRGRSENSIDFISVYWKEDQVEPNESRFSVLKYGLYGAFERARQCFNQQRELDENEISIELNFERMLPKFLGFVTQKQINYLGIAKELEGVSYSKTAT